MLLPAPFVLVWYRLLCTDLGTWYYQALLQILSLPQLPRAFSRSEVRHACQLEYEQYQSGPVLTLSPIASVFLTRV